MKKHSTILSFLLLLGAQLLLGQSLNVNSLINPPENRLEPRELYRSNGIKKVKEYYQATTAEPKFISSVSSYDREGRIVQSAMFEKRDTVEVTDFYYNESGNLSKTVNRTKGDLPEKSTTEYIYGPRSRLEKVLTYSNGKSVSGTPMPTRTEKYTYNDTTETLMLAEREADRFEFQSLPGDTIALKVCYHVNPRTGQIQENPYGYYKYWFYKDGQLAIKEYYEDGIKVYRGQFWYQSPGQFLKTINKEYPYKALMTDFSYNENGLLKEAQSTDGSFFSYEYETW